MKDQQQKIEAMRQEAAKRGVILPPLPNCRAPRRYAKGQD